jgi:uncharacterized protein
MELNSALARTVLIVSVIGAINWGLVGFFNWNLVEAIFGGATRHATTGGSRFIYALVGLAGLVSLIPVLTSGRRAITPTARTRPVTP